MNWFLKFGGIFATWRIQKSVRNRYVVEWYIFRIFERPYTCRHQDNLGSYNPGLINPTKMHIDDTKVPAARQNKQECVPARTTRMINALNPFCGSLSCCWQKKVFHMHSFLVEWTSLTALFVSHGAHLHRTHCRCESCYSLEILHSLRWLWCWYLRWYVAVQILEPAFMVVIPLGLSGINMALHLQNILIGQIQWNMIWSTVCKFNGQWKALLILCVCFVASNLSPCFGAIYDWKASITHVKCCIHGDSLINLDSFMTMAINDIRRTFSYDSFW